MTNLPINNNQQDEEALVENAQVTLQGGTAVLPRYYNCTITAIQQTVKINGTKNSLLYSDSSNMEINGATNSIIYASHSNLVVNHGENNVINSDSDSKLTFNNGTGNTFIRADSKAEMYGTDGLNLTFTSTSKTVSTYFTAGDGNETLNAGTSNGKIELRANTVADAISNLVASTGDGDDMLYAGTGNSTFSGGKGNNVFAFFQNGDVGGNTVITDFGKSAGNHIWLANYGFNQNDVLKLLNNSHNDINNNAVINLNNSHQITLEGVSINSMKVDNFILNN